MDELQVLASAHGGILTTRLASEIGIGRETLTKAVRRGRLRHLARGLYAAGPSPDTAELRHLELCRAFRLEYPDAVLAGRSAIIALGVPTWRVPLGRALLLRPIPRQVGRSGAVIRPLDDDEPTVETPFGPATVPASALVQVALDHGSFAGVVSADAAVHGGLVTADDLRAALPLHRRHRRVQQAAAMCHLVDGSSESPGESRLRVTLAMVPIQVEPQYVVHDDDGEFVARADFRVAGTNVLIEFDGAVKYRDGGADALIREKRREDRLRELGWIVVRFTWADLERPAHVIATVRRALARAARTAPVAG
jgi:hypothetical protein